MTTKNYPKITSAQNPRIKFLAQLQKKRERDRSGLMLIEGIRELSLAILSNVTIKDVYFCPDIIECDEDKHLLHELKTKEMKLTAVNRKIFRKIAYRESSGGFVAVAVKPRYSLGDILPSENPLLLVVDSIEKPGNLGAIIRSADSAGIDGLIVSNQKTDISNPNVIRASIGTVFTVPIAVVSPADAVEWLKRIKVTIINATPHGDTLYSDANLAAPCAVVVGSEDSGVSDIWMKASDLNIKIPMLGKADSLNVSAAATILLYEALRQRMGT